MKPARNAAIVRAQICDGLGFLGIELDEKRNTTNTGMISADTGRVAVRVIQRLAFAIERAVTVIVIACSHALGLAVPLVVAVTTALAASTVIVAINARLLRLKK